MAVERLKKFAFTFNGIMLHINVTFSKFAPDLKHIAFLLRLRSSVGRATDS